MVMQMSMSFIDFLKKTKRRYVARRTLHKLDQYREAQYLDTYAGPDANDAIAVKAQVTFYAHQIEKGLSHSDFRYGFGKKALANLSRALNKLRKLDREYENNEAYCSAISALHEYIVRHDTANYDIADVQRLFDSSVWSAAVDADDDNGGSVTVSSSVKVRNGELTFQELAHERHAIREYSDAPVTLEELTEAIDLARTAPSVCNRQAARVHVIQNANLIAQALKLQGGFNGYAMPSALLLVTADNRSFLNVYEHNEGFIDGGLFGMQLLMSLEVVGLAACPLNTVMSVETEDKARALLHIPRSENFIMYITVGHYPEQIRLCKSQRYSLSSIMSICE